MLTNICDNELTTGCTNIGTVEMHSFLFCADCAKMYAMKKATNRKISNQARADIVAYQKAQTEARRTHKAYMAMNAKLRK
jgi:hypothetical protein